MTGYTVNTGSTTKFSEGWDRVFGGKASKSAPAPKPTTKAATLLEAAKTSKTAKKTTSKSSRTGGTKRKSS